MIKTIVTALATVWLAAFAGLPAQAQILVIQGGTLIGGTGRPPIDDATTSVKMVVFERAGRRYGLSQLRQPDPRVQFLAAIVRAYRGATLPAEAIANAGMYKVSVKSRGEPVAESYPAPLVVRIKQ